MSLRIGLQQAVLDGLGNEKGISRIDAALEAGKALSMVVDHHRCGAREHKLLGNSKMKERSAASLSSSTVSTSSSTSF